MITQEHLRVAVDERLTRDEAAPSIEASLIGLEVQEPAFRSVARAFVRLRMADLQETRDRGAPATDEVVYSGGLIDGFVLGVIAARQEAHG